MSPQSKPFTTPSPKLHWAIFLLIGLLALAVRLPQLGERPMHTDESINAYTIGELLSGKAFHYDPQDRHGPGLPALAEPIVKLQGAKDFASLTETELRLTTVLVGTLTVLSLGLGCEMFGFISCVIAALLLALAPLPVYYDRYFIHETLFVASTWGIILAGARMLKTRALTASAFAGGFAAFMLACKETAVIHFFALASALVLGCFLCPIQCPARQPKKRKAMAAFGITFFIVTILLFTWFGRNLAVFADLLKAIPNFTARAGGEGHEKPFWYYLVLLGGGWSGALILALAGLGMLRALRQPAYSASFMLAVYALIILLAYSAIPYKTPWLALNFWLPLAIFAGQFIAWIWTRWSKFSVRLGTSLLVTIIIVLLAHDTRQWAFLRPADESNPYAYAHTGEDLLRLPGRLKILAKKNHQTDPRIAVVAADPWPLPWYLRQFQNVGFWQPGQTTGAADYFITSTDVIEPLTTELKDYRPEFFGWRPNVLLILWVPNADIP